MAIDRVIVGGKLEDMRPFLLAVALGFAMTLPAQTRTTGAAAGAGNPTLVAPRQLTAEEEARRRTAVVEAVQRAASAVINVYVKVGGKPRSDLPFAAGAEFKLEGQGSGVIIDRSGLAITNWHVVDSATEASGEQKLDHQVEITLNDETSYEAVVLSTDRERDLALLQIQLPDDVRLHAVELGDSDKLLLGETVIAIGNPYGQAGSVSVGILSAVNRDVRIGGRGGAHTQKNLLQIDAAINPGNSGGALIDINGKLIGINNAGSQFISGINFAIPVNTVREVFKNDLFSTDRMRGVYLGIQIEDRGGAVVVVEVDPGSPADRAGITVGDRLVHTGRISISTSIDFNRAMLVARAGEGLTVEVERAGKALRLTPSPLSHVAYGVLRRTGLELKQVAFSADPEAVRAASIGLQRYIAGNNTAMPSEFMAGVLRVIRIRPGTLGASADIQEGDLLLGIEVVVKGDRFDEVMTLKCEDLESINGSLGELTEHGDAEHDFLLMREGKVIRRKLTILELR